MEPMSGFEPLTYALRMETNMIVEMIAKKIVSCLAASCGVDGLSQARLFVAWNPNGP